MPKVHSLTYVAVRLTEAGRNHRPKRVLDPEVLTRVSVDQLVGVYLDRSVETVRD
ncbi:hypothetical protein GCM10020218_019540 [Dactylosporangium vinaceum]